jgi:hypothetical protein
MIYFPETIVTINTVSPIYLHNTFFLSYARELTLCMLAPWSREGVVFLDLLPSSHSVTSFLFPCLGSTDALCPRLGDPVPPLPKWRPYSQGPRTLPYRDPEQLLCVNIFFVKALRHWWQIREAMKQWNHYYCKKLKQWSDEAFNASSHRFIASIAQLWSLVTECYFCRLKINHMLDVNGMHLFLNSRTFLLLTLAFAIFFSAKINYLKLS